MLNILKILLGLLGAFLGIVAIAATAIYSIAAVIHPVTWWQAFTVAFGIAVLMGFGITDTNDQEKK